MNLGVVARPFEEPVDDAGRSAATRRDRPGRGGLDLNVEDTGGSVDDRRQVVLLVEVEPVRRAETVAERGADSPRPGRRPDDGERLEAEP